MCKLEEAQTLLDEAVEELNKGDDLAYLVNLKKSMVISMVVVLKTLGVDVPDTDNLHRLYMTIPIQYRPAIGEPEFEIFEYKYGLAMFNMSGAVPLEKEFLEGSLDLAERVLHWAMSITQTSRP